MISLTKLKFGDSRILLFVWLRGGGVLTHVAAGERRLQFMWQLWEDKHLASSSSLQWRQTSMLETGGCCFFCYTCVRCWSLQIWWSSHGHYHYHNDHLHCHDCDYDHDNFGDCDCWFWWWSSSSSKTIIIIIIINIVVLALVFKIGFGRCLYGGRVVLCCVWYCVRGVFSRLLLRNGMAPIHLAAGGGHASCIEFLVTKGADIHAKDGWVLFL